VVDPVLVSMMVSDLLMVFIFFAGIYLRERE